MYSHHAHDQSFAIHFWLKICCRHTPYLFADSLVSTSVSCFWTQTKLSRSWSLRTHKTYIHCLRSGWQNVFVQSLMQWWHWRVLCVCVCFVCTLINKDDSVIIWGQSTQNAKPTTTTPPPPAMEEYMQRVFFLEMKLVHHAKLKKRVCEIKEYLKSFGVHMLQRVHLFYLLKRKWIEQ